MLIWQEYLGIAMVTCQKQCYSPFFVSVINKTPAQHKNETLPQKPELSFHDQVHEKSVDILCDFVVKSMPFSKNVFELGTMCLTNSVLVISV